MTFTPTTSVRERAADLASRIPALDDQLSALNFPSNPLVIRPSTFDIPIRMPAEARVTSVWSKQKLFVAVFLVAIGGWFFWDGFIGYPHSNERWLAHDRLVKAGHESEWPALASSFGWTKTVPHKLFSSGDIHMQWVLGGFGTLLGLISLIFWVTQKDRTLRCDEEAVYSPAGTRIPFSSITGLGKKNWDRKGLATVLYQINGRKGRFIIDDYKFDYDATHKILGEIEEKLLARHAQK